MIWTGIRIHVTHHAVTRFLQRGLGLVDPHRSIVRLLVTAEPHRPEDWRRLADVVEHGSGSVQWRTKSGIVLAVGVGRPLEGGRDERVGAGDGQRVPDGCHDRVNP